MMFALVLLGAVVWTPAVASASAVPMTACTITDERLIGLSGLIVTPSGYVSISDSNFDKSKIRIFFLTRKCSLTRSIGYPTPAFDPEDIALGRDGTIYVADIGDNGSTRKSIAIWRLRPGSSTPRIFRYAYPDGAHDAETLLLAANDSPIFITKEVGRGDIYVPTRAADPSGTPAPLRKVGSFAPHAPFTPNGLGLAGGLLITGGANSADRTKFALRTYSTLYEWRVIGGDVVKTLTSTAPVVTPLPNEPQGESIAYSPEGSHVFTVSDQETEPVKTKILEYASGIGRGAPDPSASGSPSASGRSPAASRTDTGLSPGRALGIAVGVGAVLVLMGVVGYVSRRRR
jgi:hypothetical protein